MRGLRFVRGVEGDPTMEILDRKRQGEPRERTRFFRLDLGA
jgi:hypothetical protein